MKEAKFKRREKHPKKQNEMKSNEIKLEEGRLHQQRKLQATSLAHVKLDPAGQERSILFRQVHLSVDCRDRSQSCDCPV